MPSEEKERSSGLCWVLGLMLLPLYVVSVGPFILLCDTMGWGRSAVGVVYAPLVWLYDNTPLQGALDWYVGLWSGR